MTLFLKIISVIGAAFISGILLFAAYPPLDLSFLAWVALVPLFTVIWGRGLKRGFGLSFLCGAIYFVGIFRWILDFPGFTLLHQTILGVYVGLCLGIFGAAFIYISRRLGSVTAFLAAPLIWVSLEYIRANLGFMALPWGILTHSQYRHPLLIQICSFTGPYGVSFLIILVNGAFAALALYLMYRSGRKEIPGGLSISGRGAVTVGVTAAVAVGMTLIYGAITISRPIEGDPVRVSVVQGNIEQAKKWDQRHAKFILETYAHLTREAAKDRPDLIIWPETATPGAINRVLGLHRKIRGMANEADAPILLGSAQQQKIRKRDHKDRKYFNSAYLIMPEKGRKTQRYSKIRLMPFGEYLPMEDVIPWSYLGVPEVGSYVEGQEFTVFKLPGFRFGATICWENLFPDLVRKFVLNRAQFMVNITNEAWFGKTGAPYQFAAMSVLRAVENRRYVVRSANTGVSCFIDPHGRIIKRVTDDKGEDIFVRGFVTGKVIPLALKTFYTRYGDLFAWVCLVGSLGFLIIAFLRKSSGSSP